MPHALRAAEGEPVHCRPTDEDRSRAERERSRNIRSAADSPIEVDLGPVTDRLDDLGERVERGDDAVECRPPWFETTTAAAPCWQARSASSAVTRPFTTIGTFQRSRSSVT